MESKDFAWVVMAIRIQREVGGNLAELLHTVAATMREREYLRRQVRRAHRRGPAVRRASSAACRPCFLVYLLLVNRDYVMPLFTDPIGWLMLGGRRRPARRRRLLDDASRQGGGLSMVDARSCSASLLVFAALVAAVAVGVATRPSAAASTARSPRSRR